MFWVTFYQKKMPFLRRHTLFDLPLTFCVPGGRHKLWPEEHGLGSFPFSFTPISSFIQRKKLRPERRNDLPRVPSFKANLYLSERCFPYKVIPELQVLGLECFVFFCKTCFTWVSSLPTAFRTCLAWLQHCPVQGAYSLWEAMRS